MSGYLEARIAALEHEVAAMRRRLGSPFAMARSTMAPTDSGTVQTVQAQLDPLSRRDAVPVLYAYGLTGCPPIGADLHVAFVDGDRSKAVVIASAHQTYRLKNLGLGDSALYDVRGAYLWLTAGGPTVHCAGQPMTVTGDLHVTGAVIAGYGGADQVGVQTHVHKQAADGHGDAEADTNAPEAGT
jgi:phage gp45-like